MDCSTIEFFRICSTKVIQLEFAGSKITMINNYIFSTNSTCGNTIEIKTMRERGVRET